MNNSQQEEALNGESCKRVPCCGDSTTRYSFSMEKGHLPFLDIDIYRKTDGYLGHKVYRKSTHTNLYLHQNSHHHPANKQSVLASLIQRARALYDKDSLTQELEFLTTAFKDNGYNPQQIRRSMEPATRTAKTNDKPTSTAYITVHPNNIWPTQQNAGQTQHQKCRPTT